MMQSRPRLFVVSPHLDDAVLSCGALLQANPASIVCTVFTASPRANMSTEWDRQSGFKDAFEAMRTRKGEDSRALKILNARPVHLPFCDSQYLQSPSREELTCALRQTLLEYHPEKVLIPLGLFHSDHTLVSDACLELLSDAAGIEFLAYEEVPYRHIEDIAPARIEELKKRGYLLSPAEKLCSARAHAAEHAEQSKREAIAAYASQLRAFGPQSETTLYSTEKYWHLKRE
ncbi:PIG-L family deacetylase [Paraburkholderia sp. MPAMCS5]|uniref:PIG-L deacetylase family protein n=1 Tax=Paraburkholderia sp. MPAMCS5 TaxID=3112563 RepID=UPI002E1955AC|nr:PIG-L family deacetylase [Paraburkholderia sp. MPAMCS5]